MAGQGNARKRLFFAIYPDATTRRELADAAKPLITEGKPSRADNLHLTLAFIGMADAAYQDRLTEKASQIKTPRPFSITIDRIGHFHKARILWLGVNQPPPELVSLHDNLVSAIQPCGYKAENRPWTPHVTVARKFRKALSGKLEQPVVVRVEGFSLMQSVSEPGGVRYVEVERFLFSG